MLRCALRLAVLAGGISTSVPAATLDRDWARVYNRPGPESALAIWPAPGGGVDIVAARNGEMVYLRYDQTGTLTAERTTGIGIGSLRFAVLASDGVGGFVLAAQQDSAGQYWLVQLRVLATGGVAWRTSLGSFIEYPAAMRIANGEVYLGVDEDYYTTYDPSLHITDLSTGASLCSRVGAGGHYQRITDMHVREGGGVTLIGTGQCYAASHQGKADAEGGDECFSWLTDFTDDCLVTRDRYYPSHHYFSS